MKEINEVIQSKMFKITAAVIGVLLVMVVVFGAGVAVGLRKARFSADFGKNYERNFVGGRFDERSEVRGMGMMERGGMMGEEMMNRMHGMMQDFEGRGMRNGHGLSGSIISINDNNLIIKDTDNKENSVAVNDKTLIKLQQNSLNVSDLKVGDEIVVVGKPDSNGVVAADLIRIFPKNNPDASVDQNNQVTNQVAPAVQDNQNNQQQ